MFVGLTLYQWWPPMKAPFSLERLYLHWLFVLLLAYIILTAL